MKLPSGERFEYLLAEFGVKVPPRELRIGSSNSSGKSKSIFVLFFLFVDSGEVELILGPMLPPP